MKQGESSKVHASHLITLWLPLAQSVGSVSLEVTLLLAHAEMEEAVCIQLADHAGWTHAEAG